MNSLKRKNHFRNVFQKGRWITRRSAAIQIKVYPNSMLRVGIMASRKIGNAVVRNKARRQIREIFRLFEKENPGFSGDFVVIPTVEFTRLGFYEKQRRMQRNFAYFLGKQASNLAYKKAL